VKRRKFGQIGGSHSSGAKAHRFLSATYGTTEVVPFQSIGFFRNLKSQSAANYNQDQ
jgi:hypothetical protein